MTNRKLCYGYCLPPNSNTFASAIATACGRKLLTPDFTPSLNEQKWMELLTDCATAGAPGYALLFPDAQSQDYCEGRKPGETR